MKKLYALAIVLIGLLIGSIMLEVNADFFLTIDEQTWTNIDGLTHRHIKGSINRNGVVSNQNINYIAGNPINDQTLQVIVGDGYQPYSYGMARMHMMAENVNNLYPYFDVIAGINGDFYNMHIGIPVEVYVRNGKVLSTGLGYERDVIGFKEDGTVVFGRPCFEGHEIRVFDSEGRLRFALPVQRINNLPFETTQVTAYFENHTGTIGTDMHKFVIQGTDIKRDPYETRYFGKGTVTQRTTSVTQVPNNGLVVVSDNPYMRELVEVGDTMLVQEKMGCDFTGVNWAIGTWEKLVENSQAKTYIPHGTAINSRAPRSAIGVKSDGTVFFVTVDGRQSHRGMDGVTLYELADIMAALGAHTAYNLDGGGSTTMVLRQETYHPQYGHYPYVNSFSETAPRAVSNGIFFVRGEAPPEPLPHPLPDVGITLNVPTNIRIENGVLRWDHVPNHAGYVLELNGEAFETSSRQHPVGNLPSGENIIRVMTKGEAPFYRDSAFSEPLIHVVLPKSLPTIESLFRELARRHLINE